MANSKPNKSEFIRSQSNDLPAAQVVAKAKEAGLTMTAGLVYAVRSHMARKKKKPAAAASAGKAAAAEDSGSSASDFIRAQPTSKTAKQVAKAAAKAGFKFKAEYVYKVRRLQKDRDARKGSGTGRKPGRPPGSGKKAAAAAATGGHASAKKTLHDLMMRMGLDAFEALSSQIVNEWKAFSVR